MSGPRLEEVFKTSGVPTHTFVEPTEYSKMIVSLRSPGRGMVVEGPSGIGKTCAIAKALDDIGIGGTTERLSARKRNDVERINEIIGQRDLGIVVIDDFHKLEPELIKKFADYLKTLADEEVEDTKIVIVGINRAGDTLIKFARDLVNRIEIIKFETNSDKKVLELIEKGEEALNIGIESKDEIVKESHGSFYIAQMLSHETCIKGNVLEHSGNFQNIPVSLEVIKQSVYERLSLGFMDIAKRFASGPRLRREGRAPYLHILKWLANSDSWSVSIDQELRKYPSHKPSVGQVVQKGNLERFIENNPEFSEVINFDPSTRIFTIEDPQFIFFLRNIKWNKFAEMLGFKNMFFESKYDFALSFAGSDREVANKIFELLTEKEFSVFYDENEQHNILAENIEDYLAPIYESESKYVICLISPDYPKSVWTKFESEQFKHRFGEHSVIPIRFTNVTTSMFDETSNIGSLYFDPLKDVDNQITNIVNLLTEKIKDE
ncbi:MAG: TIR domain-containing protein [Halobacteriota archaeon]|nr:TIR domain-containing protein [Halobacteriota archaeon]